MRGIIILFCVFSSIIIGNSQLNHVFSKYTVFESNSEFLFQQLSNHSKSNFTIIINNHKLHLTPTHVLAQDYKCINQDGKVLTTVDTRAKTFEGYTDNGQHVSISVAPGFIYGSIHYKSYDLIIQPMYMYDKIAKNDTYISYRSTDRIDDNVITCGVENLPTKEIKDKKSSSSRMVGDCFEIEYAVCSDYSMYQGHGSNAITLENHIIGVTNDINTLYDDEFADALQYLITGQVIIDCTGCDPWSTSTNPSVLLSDFRSWCISNLEVAPYFIGFDISTLWTRRDFDGSTKGLAYTSPAVCATNKTNNVLEDFTTNALSLTLLATHELGHNFSAGHDDQDSPYIMAPVLNTNNTTWSTASITSIENRYMNNGGCLDSPCSPTTPSISWSIASSTVSEYSDSGSGDCGLPFTDFELLLSKSVYSQNTISVNINVTSNTTVNSSDYELLTTQIDFATGTPLNQLVTIRVYDDVIEELDEMLELSFTITSGGATIGDNPLFNLTLVSSGDEVSTTCCTSGQAVQWGNYNNSSSYFTAFNNSKSRSRFIITASDLTAIGLSAGPISQLDFYVQEKNSTGPIDNYKIGLTNHPLTSLPSTWLSTTTVFENTITTSTGWNEFEFDSNFSWDGISSLYVDICFDNGNSDSADKLRCQITSGNKGSFVTNYSNPICTTSPIGTTSFNLAPQTKLYTYGGAEVETFLGTNAVGKLQVGEIGHLYSDNQKVIASIKNIGVTDIECLDITIFTAGNGKTNFGFGNDMYTQKTFEINADNDASYEITLYYTQGELATWGGEKLNLQIVKSDVAFNLANENNISVINPLSVSTNIGSDNAIAYKGIFTGFSHFALTNGSNSAVPYLDSDIVFNEVGAGLILTSPNNTPYLVRESTPGVLITVMANNTPVTATNHAGDLYIDTNGSAIIYNSSGAAYNKYTINGSGNLTSNAISSPPSKNITVEQNSFKISKPGAGLVLKSNTGQCHKLTISNSGVLEVLTIGCP
ncbi:MAG: M12 family metallo-peptidase [Saprospiraceae bacterium]